MADIDETVSLLAALPGGPERVAWFAGPVGFGDAEVVSLHLAREGPSTLVLRLDRPSGGSHDHLAPSPLAPSPLGSTPA